MLFSSMTFVFLFLPIVATLYLSVGKKLQNAVLLLASIIFYAWGEPYYLAIMILTILITYIGANYISKAHNQTQRKIALTLTILADLSFLFYFKYFNFVVDNINNILSTKLTFIEVIMPIGISFYTFQALSYVIDVYRGEVKEERNFYKLALYITLFPQLVAGPIIKYHDIENQLDQRDIRLDKIAYGVKRFILGLSKKMLIANTLGTLADKIFALPVEQFDTTTAWLGAFAYSLQLYYDFSGYSDMAIGLGAIFGFKFLENFNYPYISQSITEFWRRWHISLSTWFKEYLYIPLGGNRVSKTRNILNLSIVFLATGIWHGASWTFVVWGLWHGFFIIFEKISGWSKQAATLFSKIAHHLYSILIFVIGWVIFRADTLAYAINYIKNMFGFVEHKISYETAYFIDTTEKYAFTIALICATPIFSKILEVSEKNKALQILLNIWLLSLFILSTTFIAASTYNPFIYFRF